METSHAIETMEVAWEMRFIGIEIVTQGKESNKYISPGPLETHFFFEALTPWIPYAMRHTKGITKIVGDAPVALQWHYRNELLNVTWRFEFGEGVVFSGTQRSVSCVDIYAMNHFWIAQSLMEPFETSCARASPLGSRRIKKLRCICGVSWLRWSLSLTGLKRIIHTFIILPIYV